MVVDSLHTLCYTCLDIMRPWLYPATVVFVVLLGVYIIRTIEGFGASQGGAFVQLQANHVPTYEDLIGMRQERAQMIKDILDMTGSV